jgi:hypothetical protein
MVTLFLERLEALDPSRLIYVKDLSRDSKVYHAAKAAVEEAARREPAGSALLEAQARAREIVRSKARDRWSFASAAMAAEDAVAGLYFRYMPGDLSGRLYRPYEPVIPWYDLQRQAWEQMHPGEAAKQKARAEVAEAKAEAVREKARREAPILWSSVMSFMGEDLLAVGIGLVLGLGVTWQVGATMGAICFLALRWGTGPTHAWARIDRHRNLKRLDAKTRSVIDTLDSISQVFGTLLAVGLLVGVTISLWH